MRHWATVVGILLWVQIYGQQPKKVDFTRKVFFSDFNEEDKTLWPMKADVDFTFMLNNGDYLLEAKSENMHQYLIPKWSDTMRSFRIKTSIAIDKTSGSGSVGVAFCQQPETNGGYVLELGKKDQYRIGLYERDGSYRPLTSKLNADGWVNFRLSKVGTPNIIAVIKHNADLEIYINWVLVETITNYRFPAGANGLYVNGPIKATVADFGVYGREAPVDTTKKVVVQTPIVDPKKDNHQEEKKEDTTNDEVFSYDVSVLTQAIIDCRKNNKDLTSKVSDLSLELSQIKNKQDELELYIAKHLDRKLIFSLDSTDKENIKLQQQNATLKRDSLELSNLKASLLRAKEGDLVLTISESLKREQEKNRKLEEELKALKEKKDKLKQK